VGAVTRVRIGNAEVNESALRDLRDAWRRGALVVFLGAGASIPYGVPSWRDLVLELLFDQAAGTRRLGVLWPHYRRAVASWMADYFDYDPLVLARMVEKSLGKRAADDPEDEALFLEQLRTHLYAHVRPAAAPTLLSAVADLLARPGSGIGSVVTFNFDHLLEEELLARGTRHTSVVGPGRLRGEGVRIVHVHGSVPREGAVVRDTLVFTEPDYHRLTESVFHWGLAEIVEALRKQTVLFLGLSMSDPSLRRLLDASRNWTWPPHYQIQKRHEVRDSDRAAVMAEIERRARRHAALLGAGQDETKLRDELEGAVHAALEQADSYDREVFESMGVKTIWVDDFSDIPALVEAIASEG
jgi:SIR2-like domain